MNTASLPVAVIGAGPVGLAAAAHLAERGEPFVMFEAGSAVGASVSAWGHVRLFSPWRYVIDQAARTLLEANGWQAPPDHEYPTGAALVRDYLAPLGALPTLAPHIQCNARVRAVTRQGFDKLKTVGRDGAQFVLQIERREGRVEQVLVRAVIDASGTYTTPNPLGASGLPAPGEQAGHEQIVYGIPDVLHSDRVRYAGKRVLVVGSGHSAFNALLDLAQLAEQEPNTMVVWAIRRSDTRQLYGGAANDGLPERGALGERVRGLVARGTLQMVTGFHAATVTATPEGIVVGSDTQMLPPVDEIIVATGFRPDLSLASELRLALDPVVESPLALAPLIDPNVHSCGTVPPHGVDELGHPEPGFYTVGMKSYGRAPTFLMLTGYEQVRSVVAALAGDWAAARDVQLVLPETGVCSTDLDGSGCCTPPTDSVRTEAAIELFPFRVLPTNNIVPLSVAASSTIALAGTCCAPTAQATCCEPDDKVDCCGTNNTSCGCAEGITAV